MEKVFKNKKILITGHSGFKGSWLSLWLHQLGAIVSGISLYHPSNPSHYRILNIKSSIKNYKEDINNSEKIDKIVNEIQPDFIFHLAAQPIVHESYANPLQTFKTNAIGSANVLNATLKLKKKCVIIMITSDKCYENIETFRGYREIDRLGGIDPYSASKASAEIIINSYVKSILSMKKNIYVGIGRAGNVIGGGDWAEKRIVPDCVRSWKNNKKVEIRNPISTRPWQHVLEPLSGYLLLACELSKESKFNGEAFNFGPDSNRDYSVSEVVREMKKSWKSASWKVIKEKNTKIYESSLLKLNCEKAYKYLKWQPTLDFEKTISMTINWYKNFYENKKNITQYSVNQIEEYTNIARDKEIKWTKIK